MDADRVREKILATNNSINLRLLVCVPLIIAKGGQPLLGKPLCVGW
jgi:hypothetical protein